MEENKFNKEQLKNSETFKQYTDILSAFLEDDKYYTLNEVKEIIDNFLKKEEK